MITFNPELYEKLGEGINASADLVQCTLGPAGRNVAFDPITDVPYILNNGKDIIKHLHFSDKITAIGSDIIKSSMAKAYWASGDGSVAAAVLIKSIWNNGMINIAAGADPMAIMRGIRKASAAAAKAIALSADKTDGFSTGDIYNIAKTAGSGRDDIAEIVSDVYEKIGPDGYVSVSDSQMAETVINVYNGVRWEEGFSGYEESSLTLENPLVLLLNKVIDDVRVVFPALEYARDNHRALLVIARELKDDVKKALAYVKANGGIDVVGVNAPGHGDVRDLNMKYFGIMFNAKVYDEITLDAEAVSPQGCGWVGKAVIGKKETLLQDIPNADDPLVLQRKEELLSQLKDIKSEDDRYRIEQMLMPISGKTAEILVGGVMEMEMFEKKYLTDNAIHSVLNAIKTGYLPGGGKAYILGIPAAEECAKELEGDERAGAKILIDALKEPMRQIIRNAGENPDSIIEKIEKSEKYTGYNVLSMKFEDFKQSGVLDSLACVQSAVEIAVSSVSTALSVSACITE